MVACSYWSPQGILFSKYIEHNGGMFLLEEYSLVSTVSTMVACSYGGILFSKYSEHNGGMFLWRNTL